MNDWLVTWTTNDGGIIREWKEECQYNMNVVNLLEKEILSLENIVSVTVDYIGDDRSA